MLTVLGAPSTAIGMLVPVREAGSLLPQMVVSSWIRRHEIRKGFWVAGALLQGVSVVAIGFVALAMEGAAAGWSTVGLLVLFSIARGLSSISSKDLLGKTIPKKRRGRLGDLKELTPLPLQLAH